MRAGADTGGHAPVRVLTFTTLFPNDQQPSHCVFVETRLRHLVAHGGVESRVVAPVAWFPSTNPRFGRYARLAAVARHEQRFGLDVLHPRYPVIPKVGMAVAPELLYAASLPVLRKVLDEGFDFDVIDAHFFYPDGVAAVALGRKLGKPVTVTARGTDIHTYCRIPRAWKRIVAAAHAADAVMTVADALQAPLRAAGVPSSRMRTLRNGVDLALFSPPDDRDAERAALGMRRRTLLSVGNLVPLKGHDLVIRALRDLPETDLFVVGSGPGKGALESLVQQLGLAERVRLVPAVRQTELRRYYGAADALVLASSREGWPNVLLEAMACGTPVVATPVWGSPEVVREARAGCLAGERSAEAIAAACANLFEAMPEREATRAYAEMFDWDDTSRGQLAIFRALKEAGSGMKGETLVCRCS